MRSISTWILIRRKIRRKGNEAVGAVTAVPESCEASQWNRDYGARGVRGEPRGWKSGAGSGARNPR
jgi:hypothetical protein